MKKGIIIEFLMVGLMVMFSGQTLYAQQAVKDKTQVQAQNTPGRKPSTIPAAPLISPPNSLKTPATQIPLSPETIQLMLRHKPAVSQPHAKGSLAAGQVSQGVKGNQGPMAMQPQPFTRLNSPEKNAPTAAE